MEKGEADSMRKCKLKPFQDFPLYETENKSTPNIYSYQEYTLLYMAN